MPKTFILIESNGMATMIHEKDIERVAAERMVSGQSFQIYRAEPMQLQVRLAPAAGEVPPTVSAPATGKKRGRRKKAKAGKAAGKKTTRSKTAAKKTTARKGKGKVGRPPVNVGPCVVSGCSRTSKTRGLCSAHYQQHRRLLREGKGGLTPSTGKAEKAARPSGQTSAPRRKTENKSTTKTGSSNS